MKWLWILSVTCLFSLVACSDDSREEDRQTDVAADGDLVEVSSVGDPPSNLIKDSNGKRPLVVYTSMDEGLAKLLFEQFTLSSGIAVKYVKVKPDELYERLSVGSSNIDADVMILPDIAHLKLASDFDVFIPAQSKLLEEAIPIYLRDVSHHWFGLLALPRTIVYARDRVKPNELSTYEALSLPKWKGKLCLLTAKKSDSKRLVATLIAHHGEVKTEAIVRGWAENLAMGISMNDLDILQSIREGECDVGMANVNHSLLKETSSEKAEIALYWANQHTTGVHLAVLVGSVTRFSDKPEEAQLLLEWLASDNGQKRLADLGLTPPVVFTDSAVAHSSAYKHDLIPLSVLAERRIAASHLMGRAGYP